MNFVAAMPRFAESAAMIALPPPDALMMSSSRWNGTHPIDAGGRVTGRVGPGAAARSGPRIRGAGLRRMRKVTEPAASAVLPTIAILGAGSMGRAILSGLLRPEVRVDGGVRVTNRSAVKAADFAETEGVRAFA